MCWLGIRYCLELVEHCCGIPACWPGALCHFAMLFGKLVCAKGRLLAWIAFALVCRTGFVLAGVGLLVPTALSWFSIALELPGLGFMFLFFSSLPRTPKNANECVYSQPFRV